MLLMDIGLGLTLVFLAIFIIWRFIDMLKANGSWKKDIAKIVKEVK
jgi:hypothetical protein